MWQLTQPVLNADDPEFANFVDNIRVGTGPNVQLVLMLHTVTSADELINFVYPPDIVLNFSTSLKHAILTPTHIQVDSYNNIILHQVGGSEWTYHRVDTLKEVDDMGLTPPDSILDYVAKHPPPSFPHHKLTIKTRVVFRLL
jgi:hypothetical protein